MSETTTTAYCCKPDCFKPAEFEILDLSDPDPYSANTHACAADVGYLLGHRPGLANPENRWEVNAL